MNASLSVWASSLAAVALVSLLSLVGVIFVALGPELSKRRILYLVSFSVGGLFGGAFFHLLPEALEMGGSALSVSTYLMLGVFTSYVIEMMLMWRHCHVPTSETHPHTFAYVNLVGDGIHNMVDGIVIGGAFLTSPSLGVATTVAIALHEIPQEIGDFGVLTYAGLKRGRALALNLLSALTSVVGVVISLTLSAYVQGLVSFLLPFAAGNFIYIAGSDLVPELKDEKELSSSAVQLALMATGAALLYLLKIR
ncbi:ZIP family metal transporter [Candidatus Bathyarchaeota archaeon]|nr:ZIP family metal transporter [Candidatus Bathyarchaeota archaeon]